MLKTVVELWIYQRLYHNKKSKKFYFNIMKQYNRTLNIALFMEFFEPVDQMYAAHLESCELECIRCLDNTSLVKPYTT